MCLQQHIQRRHFPFRKRAFFRARLVKPSCQWQRTYVWLEAVRRRSTKSITTAAYENVRRDASGTKQERKEESTYIELCTVILPIHAIDSISILESVYVFVRVELGQTFGESGSEGEGIHLDTTPTTTTITTITTKILHKLMSC